MEELKGTFSILPRHFLFFVASKESFKLLIGKNFTKEEGEERFPFDRYSWKRNETEGRDRCRATNKTIEVTFRSLHPC